MKTGVASAAKTIKMVAMGEVSRLKYQNRTVSIFVTVVFPAIIAIIVGVYSELIKIGPWFFGFLLLLLLQSTLHLH